MKRPCTAHDYYQKSPEYKDESDSDSDVDSTETDPLSDRIRDLWDDVHDQHGYILPFGKPTIPFDLSSQHPDQATIFKLWQIYIDNVNPLLKVTHTPSLQPQIINAGSNVSAIKPPLNALMFSIYCIAILSLSEEECNEILGTEKEIALRGYQVACQQALANCGILCTNDREALVALYLYLVSRLLQGLGGYLPLHLRRQSCPR